jgi:hypothetical protein
MSPRSPSQLIRFPPSRSSSALSGIQFPSRSTILSVALLLHKDLPRNFVKSILIYSNSPKNCLSLAVSDQSWEELNLKQLNLFRYFYHIFLCLFSLLYVSDAAQIILTIDGAGIAFDVNIQDSLSTTLLAAEFCSSYAPAAGRLDYCLQMISLNLNEKVLEKKKQT